MIPNTRTVKPKNKEIQINFLLGCVISFFFFFLATLGLCCCARAFSSCGEQGLLFLAVRGLLFLAVRGLLIAVASRCRARAVGVQAQ